MRKIYIVLLLLIFSSGNLFAQTCEDLFRKNNYNYYWYGIDFSEVCLIGDFSKNSLAGDDSPMTIHDVYFSSWNKLIVEKKHLFNVSEMLRKDSVSYQTSVIDTINKYSSIELAYSNKEYSIGEKLIHDKVVHYPFDETEGIGVLFLAEYLNKIENNASYLCVVFNVETREILLKERYETIPNGNGVENFWAGSYYEVFTTIREIRYDKWEQFYIGNKLPKQ